MGLVNAVVPLAELESETLAWCREILRNRRGVGFVFVLDRCSTSRNCRSAFGLCASADVECGCPPVAQPDCHPDVQGCA